MGKNSKKFTAVLILATFLSLATVVLGAGGNVINSTDEFVAKLEEEYGKIANFSARLTLSGTKPTVSVRVLAVSEPRSLRVEYLSPDQMQGQFFLLKGDYLYQYMPGRNLIIKKNLKGADLPIETANLTPEYLLKLVHSDDLEVNLIGTPVSTGGPSEGGPARAEDAKLSGLTRVENYPPGNDSSLRCVFPFGPDSLFGDYVLEAIPKSDAYQFSRQVIQFEPKSLLPSKLITYFKAEDKKTLYTTVEEVKTNLDLKLAEVTALPKDAEVIED